MNNRQGPATLSVTIGLAAAAGVASFVVGFYPGFALAAIVATVAITQRSALARTIDAPKGGHRRRNRLLTAAVFAALFGAIVADALSSDDWGNKTIVYNLVGLPAMIGAVVLLIAGLLTPKDPTEHSKRLTSAP